MIHFANTVKILCCYWINKIRNLNLLGFFFSTATTSHTLNLASEQIKFDVGHFVKKIGPGPTGWHILCFISLRLMPSK